MLSMLVLSSGCGVTAMQVADDSSLLQSFVRKQQPLADTDPLLHSVQHVANALKKDTAATMTPDQVDAAVVPLSAALNTVLQTFAEQHAHEQKEVELRFREIKLCHESPEFGEAVTARHAKRLANVFAARDQCNEAQALAIEKETRVCSEWTNHATEIYSSIPDRSQASTPEQLFEVYNTWKHWVDDKGADIELQHEECKKANTATAHHAKLCAAKTDAYEEWFCMHHLSCSALAQCHKHRAEVYTALVAEVEGGIASRQQQYQSMMHAQCLMQLINSASQTGDFIDEESMTSCHDVKVGSLSVTPPVPVPALVECPAPHSSDPQCDTVREVLESDQGKVDASYVQPVMESSSGLSMAAGFTGTSVKTQLYRPTSNNNHGRLSEAAGLLAEAAELFRLPA